MIVISHKAEGVNMNEEFARSMFLMSRRKFLMQDCLLIIQCKKVVDETNSISIVFNDVSFINSSIEYVVELHVFIVPQSRTSDVRLWG